MWIDILNRKLKNLDSSHQSELIKECAHLQEQVSSLKRHLAGTSHDADRCAWRV